MKQLLKKAGLVIAILMAGGLLRSPLENRLETRLVETHLLFTPPAKNVLDVLGQESAMAVLGGMRSVVALYWQLMAISDWEYQEWDDLAKKFEIAALLTPRDTDMWIKYAWHIHTNASASVFDDASMTEPQQYLAADDYIEQGIGILYRAVKQMPDSVDLQMDLAQVLREKRQDYCGAAEAYKRALELEGHPAYTTRFYGYMLAKCPGREREAYEHLKMLWFEDEKHHMPSMRRDLADLEVKLNVPEALRIPGLENQDERFSRQRSGQPEVP